MRKIARRILWALGMLPVLAVVVLVVALLRADRIAKAALEKGAGAALKVETRVDAVKLSPFRGRVEIRDLAIANPERFVSEQLLTCGLVRVEADVWSFLGKEAHVREIAIESPRLTIEPASGGTNLQEVLRNLGSGKKTGAPEAAKAEGDEMAFRVDRLAVRGAVARFQIGPLGQDVPLPDLELTDISNADGSPLMLRDILRQVLAQMAAAAARQGKGIVPDATIQGLATDLREMGGAAAGLVRGIGEGAVDLGKGVLDAGGKVKDLPKLLPFGPKKDEKKDEGKDERKE